MLYLEYYQNKSQTTTAVQLYYQIDAASVAPDTDVSLCFRTVLRVNMRDCIIVYVVRTIVRSCMHMYAYG